MSDMSDASTAQSPAGSADMSQRPEATANTDASPASTQEIPSTPDAPPAEASADPTPSQVDADPADAPTTDSAGDPIPGTPGEPLPALEEPLGPETAVDDRPAGDGAQDGEAANLEAEARFGPTGNPSHLQSSLGPGRAAELYPPGQKPVPLSGPR